MALIRRASLARLKLQKLQEIKSRQDSQLRLERIETSDGTVVWDVITVSDAKRLGAIFSVQRASPGRRLQLSYYGRKEPLYFGREFPTKDQAIDYVTSSSG